MKNIIQTLSYSEKIRDLNGKEQQAGENVMKQCMDVKPKDSVLIITDKERLNSEAAVFFESAKEFTQKVKLVEIVPTGEHGKEPSKEVTKMMAENDVGLLVTTYSLSHTRARKNACSKGARIASMPGITNEMILRTLTLDYTEIAELSKKIANVLTKGNEAKITSKQGTNIAFDLNGRKAIADTGLFTSKGDFGNLPAGEAFIAPPEGKTNGEMVFDGCFGDIQLEKPLKVKVENGMATEIVGGKAAETLKKRLDKAGDLSRNIAELGIGTNESAKLGTGLLEVEKVYGTCHVALGDNSTFGGTVSVPFHSDGVILDPILEVDGKKIIENNEFLI